MSCDIEKYMNGTYKKLAEQQPETHYLLGMDLKRRQMDKLYRNINVLRLLR